MSVLTLHILLHMLVNTLSAYPLSLLESFTYNYLNISVPPSQVYSKSNTWVKILWSKKQEISSKCIGKVVAYHRLKNDKIHKTRVKSCLTPRRWVSSKLYRTIKFLVNILVNGTKHEILIKERFLLNVICCFRYKRFINSCCAILLNCCCTGGKKA